MKNSLIIEDWGKIDFAKAWEEQFNLQRQIIEEKRALSIPVSETGGREHYLLFCEHNHVYTLGKSGDEGNLLVDAESLIEKEVTFYKINRGGDITYHGPGQLVAYPILDLEYFFRDIHKYIRMLEEVIIRIMDDYGLKGYRIDDFTGVWLGENPRRKICAIGVHMSRWVSMHGLAFNVNTDLDFFENIIPCGIREKDKTVTSLAQELKQSVDMREVQRKFIKHFNDLFGTRVSRFDYMEDEN
ncbi:lipoyl(octanoyl) transferase LipB [Membranihabitans maritimus]|uniref:lipoyl(octanoyl) transferase LipB n=1 Tax=Membranihabitans maritimus TaxID=2904244 RepID=UPI001EFFD2C7|nr:lipoyl(octanoyl) transferase LipB [Membranihabitans maritimus]